MAGASWQFTLSPETINEITLTQTGTSDSIVLQRQNIKVDSGFMTSHFAETNTVTISATGYQDLTNVLVGDSGLVMTPAPSYPEYLYCYTDSSAISNTNLYTDSTTLIVGQTLYDNTGSDTGLTIGVINQDGSFDLVSSYAFSFDKDNTITNYIIDGVTYTDDATVELADGTHSITVNGTKNHIYIQGYATYSSPGTAISFTVSGSNITLILPNASSNPTFDAATLLYPIQLTTINEPI